MMTYNFSMYQGDTWDGLTIYYKDASGTAINITGYTVTGTVKLTPSDPSPAATFTCTITNAVGGTFSVSLSAVESAKLKGSTVSFEDVVTYYYDIQISNGTITKTILRGTVDVIAEVTK